MTTTQTTQESRTIRGLTATSPEQLSFAPSLEVRAYLLERDGGNVLVYSTGRLAEDEELLRSRGGVERQYLNHSHEAGLGFAPAALGARLLYHEADAPEIEAQGASGITFSRRHHAAGDDLEVIPIPGHTPGATAYLWDNGEERLLFPGDTLTVGRKRWAPALLGSSDRDAYVSSLELLRSVEFDVIVPWAARIGGPTFERVGEEQRLEKLDEAIERVRSGSRL